MNKPDFMDKIIETQIRTQMLLAGTWDDECEILVYSAGHVFKDEDNGELTPSYYTDAIVYRSGWDPDFYLWCKVGISGEVQFLCFFPDQQRHWSSLIEYYWHKVSKTHCAFEWHGAEYKPTNNI